MKKTGLKESVNFFCVDFNHIDTNDILDIHKYLMKRTWYKIIFHLIKKIFIGLLTGIVSASDHTKGVSLNNNICQIQSTLINLYPNEYSQEFHYYPFAVKLDRCVGSCNTLNDLSNKVCFWNKTENLNLSVFNMITGINKSRKQSVYHMNGNVHLMEENVTHINGGITINVDVCLKNVMYKKKIILGVPLHTVVKIKNI